MGQTKRYLGDRIRSHIYDKKEVAALHQHQEFAYEFGFKNPKVLISGKNLQARSYQEAIQLKRCSSDINFRRDAQVLSVAYQSIL